MILVERIRFKTETLPVVQSRRVANVAEGVARFAVLSLDIGRVGEVCCTARLRAANPATLDDRQRASRPKEELKLSDQFTIIFPLTVNPTHSFPFLSPLTHSDGDRLGSVETRVSQGWEPYHLGKRHRM
jgi:hypothetical protein